MKDPIRSIEQSTAPVAASSGAPTILSIGFPFAVVGETAVGGAEVVLSEIEAALPGMGFRSVVVARAGSQPRGTLYATEVAPGEIDDSLRAEVEAAHQTNIDRALAEHPIALVHMHGLDFGRYRLPVGLPVVVTLHLPPNWYPETVWDVPANYSLVCVSATQRQTVPLHARDRVQVISNGVPLPERGSLRPGGRYALMLSRICPEKNLHAGFDAAGLAGLPALLAGEVFPYRDHLRYFAEEIQPRLTAPATGHMHRNRNETSAPDARFLGPVTGVAKARLLSRAACLLLPSLAPETSSLVAMEALAAGVPVVAVASGAVPEIVESGRTGLLVPPAGDITGNLAAALRQVPSLSRDLCREAAEARFSLADMLKAYAALYRQLALPDPKPLVDPSRQPTAPDAAKLAPSAVLFPAVHLVTSVVRSLPALEALAIDWAGLWAADPAATPFQHPAWLLPWARQFGPDGAVQAVMQRDEQGPLLGLLPLFLYTETATHNRKLLLLGTGTTDYLGGIFHPSAAGSAGAAALRFVMERMPDWDSLDFLQLPGGSPLLAASADLPGMKRGPAEPCAAVDADRPLPAKVGANVRRYRRRAEARGALTCTVAATAEEAAASFDSLVLLHRERWQASDEPGVLEDPRVRKHHREALPALLSAGLLRLFRLACGPDTLAILYALADPPQRPRRRLYLYLIGINVHCGELSPGTLILHEVWAYARREGFAHVDLLRGGETYKHLWGAVPETTFALHTEFLADREQILYQSQEPALPRKP